MQTNVLHVENKNLDRMENMYVIKENLFIILQIVNLNME